SGNWVKAPIVENAFIINIGDMMARWTNERWVSTLHRVIDPVVLDSEIAPCRQSIAYFMNPNYDAEIKAIPTCIENGEAAKYTPVLAGQYLRDKFNTSL
ncbi:MAG: isopenicillin N synthase family oxygenase, partial [Kordiimonadaceae bacterium]|nr:isopenicillin N synthase family oxygenase [Kordiimonadaceae bacterium]